ncbi:hypothetical protein F5883DRAFT_644332 [Diaporthe sp. PMI_573]|nr:hypothetical protein F5883DRAFT_644332 [Diaporthaceae sp. PMI_573]
MPPKRKRDDADLDDERQKFRNRGYLPTRDSGIASDCTLITEGVRIPLHRVVLISRSGYFKELLTNKDKLSKDDRGKTVATIDSHDLKSLRLVIEFLYGKSMVETMEYPSENQPIIQDSILLYNLGHDFDIPEMVAYATKHMGMYLSKKLKEICLYPISRGLKAAGKKEFMEDLKAGINEAENARPGETEAAKNNHPRLMLIDFIVVGRDVLLRDAIFRFDIDEDFLPAAFIKDAFLAQFAPEYKTTWMKDLMVRPDKLGMPVSKKRGNCAGCGEAVAKDRTVVFNPWSGRGLPQRYTQFCCEECAEGMDEGNGAGVVWDTFGDVTAE